MAKQGQSKGQARAEQGSKGKKIERALDIALKTFDIAQVALHSTNKNI
jgi:hypothetical protein